MNHEHLLSIKVIVLTLSIAAGAHPVASKLTEATSDAAGVSISGSDGLVVADLDGDGFMAMR